MAETNTNMPIRRIYIHPVKKWMRESIYQYFSQMGKVESINFNKRKPFAFLQYEDAASASMALNIEQHIINGEMIEVKAAHQKHQPTVDESSQLSAETTNIVSKLNDDCFIGIFEFLPLRDLCSVAEVCTTFKGLAQQVFSKKFAIIEVNDISDMNDEDIDSSTDDEATHTVNGVPMTLVESLFRNFGTYIKLLQLDQEEFGKKHNNRVLEIVAANCGSNDGLLKKLHLHNFTIKGHLLLQLRPVFSRLTHLIISGGSFSHNIRKLLSACSALTDLVLIEINIKHFCNQKFEKMETLILRYAEGVTAHTLDTFMRTNGQLKKLTIIDPVTPLPSSIFQSIGLHLKHLEELQLVPILASGGMKENLRHMSRTKHLKLLYLHCVETLPVNVLLDALVDGNVPIEDLRLYMPYIDSNVANSLSKMKKVKNLRLGGGSIMHGQFTKAVNGMEVLASINLIDGSRINTSELKEIIKTAKKLTNSQLADQDNIVIESNDFNAIAESIRGVGNERKLNIEIEGKGCKLMVSQSIIERNAKWLNVDVTEVDSESESDEDEDSDEDSDEESDEDLYDDFDYFINFSDLEYDYDHYFDSDSDSDSDSDEELYQFENEYDFDIAFF